MKKLWFMSLFFFSFPALANYHFQIINESSETWALKVIGNKVGHIYYGDRKLAINESVSIPPHATALLEQFSAAHHDGTDVRFELSNLDSSNMSTPVSCHYHLTTWLMSALKESDAGEIHRVCDAHISKGHTFRIHQL